MSRYAKDPYGDDGVMYQSRLKNAKKRAQRQDRNRTLLEPEDGQDYAIVESMLGNGRLSALCGDGQTRVARIRGSMRKGGGKVIVGKQDLIIVALRDYQADAADVIHKFNLDEVHDIIKWNLLPPVLQKALTRSDFLADEEEDNGGILFAEDARDVDIGAI